MSREVREEKPVERSITSVIVVVVALLAFAGYTFYNRQQSNKKVDNTATTQQTEKVESATATDVAKAPDVNGTADLDKVSATLDQTDPAGSNNSDVAALDSQLNGF